MMARLTWIHFLFFSSSPLLPFGLFSVFIIIICDFSFLFIHYCHFAAIPPATKISLLRVFDLASIALATTKSMKKCVWTMYIQIQTRLIDVVFVRKWRASALQYVHVRLSLTLSLSRTFYLFRYGCVCVSVCVVHWKKNCWHSNNIQFDTSIIHRLISFVCCSAVGAVRYVALAPNDAKPQKAKRKTYYNTYLPGISQTCIAESIYLYTIKMRWKKIRR